MQFLAIFWLLLTTSCVRALYVTAGSPCASTCHSPQNGTYWPDLVCSDSDFATDPKGLLLQSCLNCAGQSLYTNGTRSDEYWYLFHLKYVQQACLIETQIPHTGAVLECATECAPLRNVLKTLWISSNPFLPQYDYCTSDSSAFPTYAPKCATCLQAQSGAIIIGNMVETMANACVDKPLAANKELVKTTRSIWNTTVIPLASSTTTSTGNTSPTTSQNIIATSSAQPSTGNTTSGGNQISAGVAAGVAIGVVAILLLVAVAVYLLIRKRRRARLTAAAANPNEPYVSGVDFKGSKGGMLYKEMPAEPSRREVYSREVLEADGRPVEKSSPVAELPGLPYR